MREFFVSTDGDDEWSGTLPEPNQDRTDGPFRTLGAAQEAVRREKDGTDERGTIRVRIRGGRYELGEPWRFSEEDSGYGRKPGIWPQRAETWPVIWTAYEDERPVISGGRRIEGPWQRETINGREVWTTMLPEHLRGEWTFSQLWVNGERRFRPRLPKSGVRQVDRAVDPDFEKHGHRATATSCGFKEGELKDDWHNLHDVELHFFGWWIDKWVKIRDVDEDDRLVTFDRDAGLRMAWAPGDGIDYRVVNVFEALTEPGEWYLDRATGKLYYIPQPGEDMETADVVAPGLDALLWVGGTSNLQFEGLTFAHSEWTLPEDLAGSKQAAVHVPAALTICEADDVAFQNCRVEHVGSYGAEILDGTVEAVFDHCTFSDLGAGGVRIWHGCRRNALLDCEIGDGGQVFSCGVGVLIGKSTGNRVVHCHIHDFFYTGISVGWNWGYAESNGYGNIIEWNHIHDIGKGLLSDMGGIYLLGHAAGTRLRYNRIHDITCRRYGGWCIYTDEGSTDVLIESNLCYRANRTAFNQHYGRNNQVRNNILAYGGDAVISYGKPEPHLGLIFERNILLSDEAPILRNAGPDRWTPEQTAFHRNLYWCETGPVVFDRGGAAMYGSQPFPDGYLGESDDFAPLPEVPRVSQMPEADDWKEAAVVDRFFTQSGADTAPSDLADVRLLRTDGELLIRGRFQRPDKFQAPEGPIWQREHIEVFLRPYPDREAVLQLGLASDGATEAVWHGCPAPDDLGLTTEIDDAGDHWVGLLRIPLDPVAAAANGGADPEWRFLIGFATPCELGDFDSWQAQGHDPGGKVADPLFVAPHEGNFALKEDSPALALGFVPWDQSKVGPRS